MEEDPVLDETELEGVLQRTILWQTAKDLYDDILKGVVAGTKNTHEIMGLYRTLTEYQKEMIYAYISGQLLAHMEARNGME